MDCRILLIALLALPLLSAMTLDIEETFPGTVHYRVVERGASGATLYIIAMVEGTQHSVTPVTDFNGIAEGDLLLTVQGEYTITAKNLDTGAQASATIQVPQAQTLAQVQDATDELEAQVIDANTTMPIEEETSLMALFLAAGLLVLLAVVLIYGNPFKETSKARARKKKKRK